MDDGPEGDAPEGDAPLSAIGSLAVIQAEGRRVGRLVRFNPAIVNAMWAVAWFVGFGCAFLAYGPDRLIPGWLGPAVAAALLVAAEVASFAYGMRVGSGIAGPSRTSAAMYGWSWTLGYVCLTVLNVALTHRGLSGPDVTLLWSGSSLLLAGVLHLTGGTLFRDPALYAVGVWTMVCAAVAVVAGVPGNFLVLAFAGGGGFAALAVYTGWVRPRRARR
ncbi:hypothetical protein [Rugosimonospora acidiphila]|uniref:hypothetical protein n=1 Tax=Rugosimonospora acidiphila TaxID=556531 RepID=UPI0031E587B0